MTKESDTDDRQMVLYHGTTLDVAQKIVSDDEFELRNNTFFAAMRALASIFAKRSSVKRGRGQSPALVRVVLLERDLDRLMRNRLVQSKGFDEGDAVELFGKTQYVFSSEGMRVLNRSIEDMSVEQLVTPNNP